MKLVILASFVFACIASAATIPLTGFASPVATEDIHAVFYPGTAQSIDPKARIQITNAELLRRSVILFHHTFNCIADIRRGQPLAKPIKLYNAVGESYFSYLGGLC
jgi:hypothetical protein